MCDAIYSYVRNDVFLCVSYSVYIRNHKNRHYTNHSEWGSRRVLRSTSNQSSTPVKWHSTHNKGSATHCSTLQHPATSCNTLQHTATHCNTLPRAKWHSTHNKGTATHCSTLQHPATSCNTLQHTATRCHVRSGTVPATKAYMRNDVFLCLIFNTHTLLLCAFSVWVLS